MQPRSVESFVYPISLKAQRVEVSKSTTVTKPFYLRTPTWVSAVDKHGHISVEKCSIGFASGEVPADVD